MCCRGLKWWPRRLPRQGSYELLVLYSKKEQPRSSSQKKNKLFNQLNMRLLLGCGPHILISFCPRSHGQFDGLGVTSRVKSYEDSPIQTHQKRVKEAEEPWGVVSYELRQEIQKLAHPTLVQTQVGAFLHSHLRWFAAQNSAELQTTISLLQRCSQTATHALNAVGSLGHKPMQACIEPPGIRPNSPGHWPNGVSELVNNGV